MRENKFEDLISKKPETLMIKSNDLEKGLSLKCVYPQKAQKRYLSIGDKAKLLDLMRKDTALFLDRIIEWHLDDDKILSFINGRSSLLPIDYQRFYSSCVAIETENYKLYINDKAIERCSDIVFKLSERSKKDCFEFAKGKLEKNQAEHLYIAFDSLSNQTGRSVSFVGEDDFNVIMPDNTVCYTVYPKENGVYEEDDINNILLLMDEFTKTRGFFRKGKRSSKDLVMYNQGSMKIEGIDKDKRILEKAKILTK